MQPLLCLPLSYLTLSQIIPNTHLSSLRISAAGDTLLGSGTVVSNPANNWEGQSSFLAW